jgi:Uma2 family endonuclease
MTVHPAAGHAILTVEEIAMSAVLESPAKARITPEDMLRMPDQGRGYELVDGELEEMPVSFLSDFVARRISTSLALHVELQNLGWVSGEGTSYQCFPDDEDKVRRADVGFHRLSRLTASQAVAEGHLSVAPDLVVEVLSPNDLVYKVNAKRHEWLTAGVRVVWTVDPVQQTVQVHKADGSVAEFKRTDVLTGDPVVPDFKVVVGDWFKLPTD